MSVMERLGQFSQGFFTDQSRIDSNAQFGGFVVIRVRGWVDPRARKAVSAKSAQRLCKIVVALATQERFQVAEGRTVSE